MGIKRRYYLLFIAQSCRWVCIDLNQKNRIYLLNFSYVLRFFAIGKKFLEGQFDILKIYLTYY